MKETREFFDPTRLPWRPAAGFGPGVWEQIISGGRDEGVTTRFLRFDPGSGNDAVVTHDFPFRSTDGCLNFEVRYRASR